MKDIIEKLIKCKNEEDFCKELINHYDSLMDKVYMPALIKEGNIFKDGSDGELYGKLILVPKNKKIEKTWMISNFEKTMPVKPSDDFIYNVLTFKNYKRNDLYDVNPVLYGDHFIIVNEQKNDVYSDLILDTSDENEIPVFKNIEIGDTSLLMMHSDILSDHVAFEDEINYNVKPFDLYLEFEFQSKIKLKLKESKGAIKNGYLDVFHTTESMSKITSITLGTIKIETINKLNPVKIEEEKLNIKTISLDDGSIREINVSNYDDDINAGFVVFSSDGISLLSEDFLFFDMVIVNKQDRTESFLIDVFQDYFVFWEGEFNKLPKKIKKELAAFNIVEKPTKIISDAMYSWQIKSSWEYMQTASPFVKLAAKVREDKFDIAFDYDISFTYPTNNKDLKLFLENVEKLFRLTPNNFDTSLSDIENLKKVFEGENVEIDKQDYFNLTERYSNAILGKIHDK